MALWKKEDVPSGSDTYIRVVCNLVVVERKEFMNICVLSDIFEFLFNIHPAIQVSLLCIL